MVQAMLRRQGIQVIKIRKQKMARGGRISEKDIALFTRQLATMMKLRRALLQAFDIAMKGLRQRRSARLLNDIRTDVETGSNLSQAFAKHPRTSIACSATWSPRASRRHPRRPARPHRHLQGKDPRDQEQDQSALFYPTAVVVVAGLVISVMMLFVIPEFKSVFPASAPNCRRPR